MLVGSTRHNYCGNVDKELLGQVIKINHAKVRQAPSQGASFGSWQVANLYMCEFDIWVNKLPKKIDEVYDMKKNFNCLIDNTMDINFFTKHLRF